MKAARETFLHTGKAPKGQCLSEKERRKLSGERIAAGRVSEMNSSPMRFPFFPKGLCDRECLAYRHREAVVCPVAGFL